MDETTLVLLRVPYRPDEEGSPYSWAWDVLLGEGTELLWTDTETEYADS